MSKSKFEVGGMEKELSHRDRELVYGKYCILVWLLHANSLETIDTSVNCLLSCFLLLLLSVLFFCSCFFCCCCFFFVIVV